MTDVNQLVQQLSGLSENELDQVMDEMTRQRSMAAPAADERAGFAEWLAKRYLGFNPKITKVIYLPAGAPEREIRMIAVNAGLFPDPRDDAIVPVESTPAVTGLPFRVYVADVTPQEWEGLKERKLKPPAHWNLDSHRTFGRRVA